MPKIRNVRVWVVKPDLSGRIEVAGFWQHGSVTIATFITWLGICITLHDAAPESFPAGAGEEAIQNLDAESISSFDTIDIGDPSWGLYQAPHEFDEAIKSDPAQMISMAALQDKSYEEIVPVGDYLILNRDDLTPLWATLSTFPYLGPTSADEPSPTDDDSSSASYIDRIRLRDGACCLTNLTKEDCGDTWSTFAVAHIFPRSKTDVWIKEQLHLLIKDDGPFHPSNSPAARIDSVQNLLLLQLTEHALFTQHHLVVDVDAGYSVLDFTRKGRYQGRRMTINSSMPSATGATSPASTAEPAPSTSRRRGNARGGASGSTPGNSSRYRVLDDLLRFHHLQGILKNVRGAGRADPASEIVRAASIQQGPQPQQLPVLTSQPTSFTPAARSSDPPVKSIEEELASLTMDRARRTSEQPDQMALAEEEAEVSMQVESIGREGSDGVGSLQQQQHQNVPAAA